MATINFIWNGKDDVVPENTTSYHLGATSGHMSPPGYTETWTGVNLRYSPGTGYGYPTGGAIHSWSLKQTGTTFSFSMTGLNHKVTSGTSYETLISDLMAGRDDWHGNAGNNYFYWSAGGDTYHGGVGIDTLDSLGFSKALIIGNKPNFTRSGEVIALTATGDLDVTLNSVERLRFKEVSVALDLNGNAGAAARIVGAVFGRDQIKSKDLVGIAIGLLDSGMAPLELTRIALDVKLGDNYTHAALVNLVYKNVTNTAPSALDMQLYGSMLDKGQFTGAELTWAAAASTTNAATIDLTGLSTTGLDYLPWLG
ncbi:hypothetical protein HLB44_20650 [Aquincola sp. S2]|uniref:DUF4214 domain-containing protein n=1 Tax=Pseudaquabacterium terrae TaxID=2732868 RepID=A0ABX2ELL6_9BURK|nr:hypothetical protein [Aquabacterium terrae]NRF69414.1 hypothetical protein [Aquabacterium terrae]